jgi:hypothetical protein
MLLRFADCRIFRRGERAGEIVCYYQCIKIDYVSMAPDLASASGHHRLLLRPAMVFCEGDEFPKVDIFALARPNETDGPENAKV